jgi:hypothetical protein
MDLATADPEDVKSALRKRHRSVAAFERIKSLPEKSVHDVLRGRPSKRVLAAITDELSEIAYESENSDSTGARRAHGLNAGAR